jgi:hypothetical protein
MQFERYRTAFGIRFDLLQGAMALQELPRAVRLFQVSLRPSHDAVIASEAKQSISPRKEGMDCFVASLLEMTAKN